MRNGGKYVWPYFLRRDFSETSLKPLETRTHYTAMTARSSQVLSGPRGYDQHPAAEERGRATGPKAARGRGERSWTARGRQEGPIAAIRRGEAEAPG